MIERHDFQVYFYRTQTANDKAKTAVREYFSEVASEKGNVSSVMLVGETGFFITGLKAKGKTEKFHGAFSKLRKANLPRIGDENGVEKDIKLAEGQGLIEKNFFVYDSNRCLLVWQQNTHASHISRFEEYLCDKMPENTTVAPVVEEDALERIMDGGVMLSAFDISFALPTNPEMIPNDVHTQKIYELMSGLNIDSIRIHASANAPGRGTKRTIMAKGKKMLQGLKEMPGTRVVRAKADGTGEHIDLIAERLTTEITVRMDGHYPHTPSMFNRLEKSMKDVSDDLEQIFGDEDNQLD